MKDNLSSIFHKPEFKQLLAKYTDMINNRTPVYLEPDEITLLAEYYASTGNTKSSERVVNYGLSLHPDNLDIQIFKCHNLVISGKTDEAQQQLESLPDPNDYEVRLLQAEIYLAQERDEEADQILKDLYLDEQELDVILDIAHMYMEYQRKQKAYQWLQKAQEEDPDSVEVLEEMAAYQFTFGDTQKAIDLYNRLLDEAPYTLEFWQNLTRCYLRMDKPEKALEAIEFAIAIDDADAVNWELKVNCLFVLNQVEKAIGHLVQLEQKACDKTYVQNILLTAYYLLLDCKKILEYSDKLLASNQVADMDMAALYHKRATAHLGLGKPRACANDIRQGLAYDNHYSLLYQLKGEFHLIENKVEEARTAFHYGELYSDNLWETYSFQGMSYFKHGHLEDAARCFLKQEEVNRYTMGSNYYMLAHCLLMKGDEQEVLKYLIRAIVYAPEVLGVPMNEDEPESELLEVARAISQRIESGAIDPTPYLND